MTAQAQMFRIATWNLERPKQKGWTKNQRRLDKIREIAADVWVLTETSAAIALPDSYQCVASQPIANYHQPGEHLTMLWSRWTIRQCLLTFDPTFAVCAEIDSPFGNLIVYGTVFPYANDKGHSGTAKCWEEHRRSLQQQHQDWLRLQQQFPNHLWCIAGDFNQSRDDSGWYADQQSVDFLTTALQNLAIACVTQENFQENGKLNRSTVDHICLSHSLQAYQPVVGVWAGKTPVGEAMSDHNGVYVDLQVAQP